jgi:[acyl-carrier-protein] S-malonyltransferase
MNKFAFVFPGQGSQAVGMMEGFAGNPVVAQTIAEASDALQFDLGKLIAEGPKEELDLTTNTQPVMLTAAVAAYRAWIAAGGPLPTVVAGHSLGEYSALVAAGVISFKDAVPLVRFRAQAMQEAVPVGQGTMAVMLGLSDDDVRAACAEAAAAVPGEVVEAVNYNAIPQPSTRHAKSPRPRAPSAPCACRCRRRSTARCSSLHRTACATTWHRSISMRRKSR